MKVILVGGVHGVGKSTVCREVANKYGIPHYTASQIIRNEKSSAVSTTSKQVVDVDENQRLLIQGIDKLVKDGCLLLDGHLTVQRKSDGGIEPIRVDVFRKLQVDAIIVFEDDPAEIAKRMQLRDEVAQPIELLKLHQEAELVHAEHVANSLNVPLVVFKAFDTQGVTDIIKKWGI